MIKRSLDRPLHENVFIRQAIAEGIRLDGRGVADCRDVVIELSRDEGRSESSISIGSTRVICVVSGEVIVPYPDRPTEGMLRFSVDVSVYTEQAGHSSNSICRVLERSIRDSEALDTESLCIIAGEKVWCVNCDLRVLNYDGNVTDACNLAAMSALRAFRKPEVSVSRLEIGGASLLSTAPSSVEDALLPLAVNTQVKLHSSDEREPLPLALHHTPLSVTFGLFSRIPVDEGGTDMKCSKLVLVADPSSEEEEVMDGFISYSVNAHGEVCAVLKPGGAGMSTAAVLRAAALALDRAPVIHSHLQEALAALEQRYIARRTERLEQLRAIRLLEAKLASTSAEGNIGELMSESNAQIEGSGGIDIDDPILRYDFNHATAPLGKSKEQHENSEETGASSRFVPISCVAK